MYFDVCHQPEEIMPCNTLCDLVAWPKPGTFPSQSDFVLRMWESPVEDSHKIYGGIWYRDDKFDVSFVDTVIDQMGAPLPPTTSRPTFYPNGQRPTHAHPCTTCLRTCLEHAIHAFVQHSPMLPARRDGEERYAGHYQCALQQTYPTCTALGSLTESVALTLTVAFRLPVPPFCFYVCSHGGGGSLERTPHHYVQAQLWIDFHVTSLPFSPGPALPTTKHKRTKARFLSDTRH